MMRQLHSLTAYAARLTALTRPQIALQAAVYMLLGAYLAEGSLGARAPQVSLAAIVTGLIVSFGFVINDYADVEVDRLAKPFRPLPSGLWTQAEALRLAILLALVALTLSLALPFPLGVIACANLVLAAGYSLLLKRTVLLGNIAVGLLNSSILIFGAIAAGGVTFLVWSVASMSLLYTLAQEVLYTVDDVVGDRASGLVTTAVYFGVGPSLSLFRALIVLALLASLAPIVHLPVSPWYLAALVSCTIAPILLHIFPLVRYADPMAISRACAALKVVRVTSVLPLVLLPALT